MRKIFLPATLWLAFLALAFNAPAGATHGPRPPARPTDTQAATAPSQAGWETYTFDGEEFSVALPEMPALDHSSRPLKGQPDENEKMRNYGAYNDGVVYLIRAYDKPRAGEDLDYFARHFMEQFLNANLGIETKAQREMTLGKFPGRQYVIRKSKPSGIPDSSIYVFLTGRHAYALRAVGGDDNHPDVQRFLASFALADKPAGRQIVDARKLPRTPVPFAVTPPEKKTSPEVAPESKGTAPRAGGGAPQGWGRGVGTGPPKTVTNATASAGGSAAGEQSYKASEVTRKALLVYKPEPYYTEEARRNGVTGVVRLRILLSSTGKVTNIVVAGKSLPDGLNETAAFAARHIKFIPAIKDGRRVSQYVTIEYNFNFY